MNRTPRIAQAPRSGTEPPLRVHADGGPGSALATIVAARWARLGVGFPVAPASETPDLEQLIVDTIQAGRTNSRLLLMAAAWLRRYGAMVARHRLAQLARTSLGDSERAVLGWLLEESARPGAAEASAAAAAPASTSSPSGTLPDPAQSGDQSPDQPRDDPASSAGRSPASPRHAQGVPNPRAPQGRPVERTRRGFREVLAVCRPASRIQPVFDVHRRHPALLVRLGAQGSAVARRWNLLAEPLAPKADALRHPEWIRANNPTLATRALLGGDLRASILAALQHDEAAGASELELARRCCASRAAVREALDRLELAGLVRRSRTGRRRPIVLVGVA